MQSLIAEKFIVKHVIASLVLTAALAVVFATPAHAQVAKNLNEVGGRGSVESGKYSDEDERTTSLNLNMFYGRFVHERISVGPSLGVNKFGDGDANGNIGGFVNYHFGNTSSKMVPFAEVALGRFFGGDDDATYVSVGPGAKVFLGEGGAFVANAFYRRLMADVADSNEFGFQVGVSVFFGR